MSALNLNLTFAAVCFALVAAAPPSRLPRFDQFPVKQIYTGPVAEPKITKPPERQYRTAIAMGVRKGYGVLDEPSGRERERPGPNFAGHYIVIQWGCGSNCLQYAIVDAKTGAIYQPPVPGSHQYYFDTGELIFRLQSNLMVVKTKCDLGFSEECDSDFYLWTNQQFKRIAHQSRKKR